MFPPRAIRQRAALASLLKEMKKKSVSEFEKIDIIESYCRVLFSGRSQQREAVYMSESNIGKSILSLRISTSNMDGMRHMIDGRS